MSWFTYSRWHPAIGLGLLLARRRGASLALGLDGAIVALAGAWAGSRLLSALQYYFPVPEGLEQRFTHLLREGGQASMGALPGLAAGSPHLLSLQPPDQGGSAGNGRSGSRRRALSGHRASWLLRRRVLPRHPGHRIGLGRDFHGSLIRLPVLECSGPPGPALPGRCQFAAGGSPGLDGPHALSFRPSRGYLLASYFLGYGTLRFVVEFVRGDLRPFLGPLSLNQWLCAGFVAAGLLLIYCPAIRSDPVKKRG